MSIILTPLLSRVCKKKSWQRPWHGHPPHEEIQPPDSSIENTTSLPASPVIPAKAAQRAIGTGIQNKTTIAEGDSSQIQNSQSSIVNRKYYKLTPSERKRILLDHVLPPSQRYKLTDEQVDFIISGGDGLTGLDNKEAGPYAWTGTVEKVFPKARYFYKGGMISTYTLDVAYIDDPESGARFILALAAESGDPSTVTHMAAKIAQWIRDNITSQ